MSQNSFPRPEHISALKVHASKIAARLGVDIVIEDFGVDRYRCNYRLRLKGTIAGEEQEISVHFQQIEKLLADGVNQNLDRQLERSMQRYYSAFPTTPEGGDA